MKKDWKLVTNNMLALGLGVSLAPAFHLGAIGVLLFGVAAYMGAGKLYKVAKESKMISASPNLIWLLPCGYVLLYFSLWIIVGMFSG
jgi:hypothetical protein